MTASALHSRAPPDCPKLPFQWTRCGTHSQQLLFRTYTSYRSITVLDVGIVAHLLGCFEEKKRTQKKSDLVFLCLSDSCREARWTVANTPKKTADLIDSNHYFCVARLQVLSQFKINFIMHRKPWICLLYPYHPEYSYLQRITTSIAFLRGIFHGRLVIVLDFGNLFRFPFFRKLVLYFDLVWKLS